MADTPSHAVFLSYASQDAAAVQRVAEALRAAGVEVWFDQNELVGGDAWDAKIRGQIASCALFVPVISAATQARHEGYFRLEWKLAAQRTHMMSGAKAFLLPVVIDETRDAEAHVPAEFRAVQWTRLPGGETPEKFCARVRQLLGGSAVLQPALETHERGLKHRATPEAGRRVPAAAWGIAVAVVACGVGGYAWLKRPPASAPISAQNAGAGTRPPTAEKSASSAPVAANDKSLVVLPLENLSPDPENAAFTDGMHWDIIAALQRALPDLKVISRDSALALKSTGGSLAEKAQKVGVANVITGSVRRVGDIVRIQLELRRASDEALLWSLPNGNKELKDILGLQSEVADQVARVLQARVTTGSFVLARFTTQNPRAYDLYIQALTFFNSAPVGERGLSTYVATIEKAEQAMALDPSFAGGASLLAIAQWFAYRYDQDPHTRLHHAAESKRWAETAARLVPGGAGDYGLASYYGQLERDYARGLTYSQNVARALPNEATAFNYVAIFSSWLGQQEEAGAAYRRALALDPLRPVYWTNYLGHLAALRRMGEFQDAQARYHASTRGQDLPAWQYLLAGELPVSLDGMSSNTRVVWLWRARRVADVATLAAAELAKSETKDLDRLIYLRYQTDALQKLGRTEDAGKSAAAMMALVQKLAEIAEVGPSEKNRWQALALARLGKADEAVNAARRHMEAVRTSAPRILLQRELEVAELFAYLARPRECVELLARLLRVPSGVTVPMLKVDPTWDNVREDAGFKALLADPKNSAPL